MVFGGSAIGTTAFGELPVEKVVEAIELSSDIPPVAKQAVKEFVKDSFKSLWDTIEELILVDPPSELLEWWPIIEEICKKLMGT